jgi:YD repeat-containing protein
MDSGYSIEYRVKMPQNTSNSNTCYIANNDAIAAIFTDISSGTYLHGFSNDQGASYGHHNGGNDFDYILVDPAHGFDNFQNIRLKVTRTNFYVFYNNNLVRSFPRDSTKAISTIFNPVAAFVGNDVAIDWLKVYDRQDNLKFMEDFNYPDQPVKPIPALICPQPTDCRASFRSYFNQQRNTSYTYHQIDSIYRYNYGKSPEVCFEVPPAGTSGPRLCGKSEPLYPQVSLPVINSCTDSTFYIISKATELFRVYKDSVMSGFQSAYRSKCLEAYRYETFTVRHEKSEYHYTLYYYDQAGNLVKSIPPDSVTLARTANQLLTPDHVLVTGYRYNTLNQVVAQTTPDGGKSNFWYDRLGRLSFSQNARQKAASTDETGRLYSYTFYDPIGRIIEVGEIANVGVIAMTDSISRRQVALQSWVTASSALRSQVINTVYDIPYPGFTGLGAVPLIQKEPS